MVRTLAILTLAATGIASVYGASLGINPGDVLNSDGSVSIGLLPSNPVAGNSGAGPTGGIVAGVCNPTTNPDCITTNSTSNASNNFAQRNLFTGASFLNSGVVTPPMPDNNPTHPCTTGNCQQTIYNPGAAPVFNMLGDGLSANAALNSNIWYSLANTGPATISIPVGILGVTSVSTMLNTVSGLTTGGTNCITNNGLNAGTTSTNQGCQTGGSYASVTLSFAKNADGTGATATETFALINGLTQRNIFDGIVGGASTLAGVSGVTGSGSYNVTDSYNNKVYAVGVGNEWNGTISGSSTTALNGGKMVLDYQTFPVFDEYLSYYLMSVSIVDNGSAATNREVLSAVTVSSAPEPSTILMAVAGFGAMMFAGRRRKR